MAQRGRKALRGTPMTAADRQKLERERNRRARETVNALVNFQGVDWEQQRELTRIEILNSIHLLSKWATEGQAAIDWWRLTFPPDRLAYVADVFERMQIQIPFCSACGSDLQQNEMGWWERCQCRRKDGRPVSA